MNEAFAKRWLAPAVAGAAFGLAFGAWAAEPAAAVVEHASWLDVIVLGIPLGVLAAALAGSSARSLREQSQPDSAIPRRVLWTIVDGFIGGWGAMFLLGFSYTRPVFESVGPPVLGAFGGLLCDFVRNNGAEWARQGWQATLGRFSRNGGTPP